MTYGYDGLVTLTVDPAGYATSTRPATRCAPMPSATDPRGQADLRAWVFFAGADFFAAVPVFFAAVFFAGSAFFADVFFAVLFLAGAFLADDDADFAEP